MESEIKNIEQKEGLEEKYKQRKVELSDLMCNKNTAQKEKLKALIALADTIGSNKDLSENFEKDVLRTWIRSVDPELFDAYQKNLRKIFKIAA